MLANEARFVKRVGIILSVILLFACGGGGGGGGSATTATQTSATCGLPGSRCTGSVAGYDYILYTPANFKPNSGALVMALHPRHGNGESMENLTGMNAKAEQAGFAVLYPSAPARRMWCWYFQNCDDIAGLRTLISTVQATLKADPKRIYATGYSDGATMSHRIGVEMGDVVAAIAPLSGDIYEGIDVLPMPAAKNGVSVLMLHADLPPDVSYFVCGRSIGPYMIPSQDEVFSYWTGPSANSCGAVDTTTNICNGARQLQLTAKNAKNCKGSVEVQFYQLLNVSHGWFNVPGHWSTPMNVAPDSYYVGEDLASQKPYNPNLNATTGVTANDIIWNFFAAHPKQ